MKHFLSLSESWQWHPTNPTADIPRHSRGNPPVDVHCGCRPPTDLTPAIAPFRLIARSETKYCRPSTARGTMLPPRKRSA